MEENDELDEDAKETKGKSRKKKLTLSKETLKDLKAAERAGGIRGGAHNDCSKGMSGCSF